MLRLLISREATVNVIVATSVTLIVIGVILTVCFILLLVAWLSYRTAFGSRYDKNPYLKYFTAEDYGLNTRPVNCGNGLRGFLYEKQTTKNALIIFCHGMGPGQIAYTTEIAYFCKNGYMVFALDSVGCNMSEGKSIKGMYTGVDTAVAAIDFAKLNFVADNMPVYLVGHSWGAYSALCATSLRKVDKVVAISPPDTPSKTLQGGAAMFIGKPFAAILRPFWWCVNFLKYGVKGNTGASRMITESGVPALIVHGDKDNVVSPANAVYYKAKGGNVKKVLASGKAHNPYNTIEAEKSLAEISVKLKNGDKDFSSFDFTATVKEDEEIMRKILEFLKSN